jgi:DNA repair photolyase
MVLRDLDLLAELARHADVTVHFTVTTMDETLWRKIEPTTSKPHKRIEAMRTLREHGIRSGIFLSPVLPGLTDDLPHLEAVVAAAAQAGADFLFSQVLRLGPGIGEYYLPFIQAEFPALAPRYEELYRRNSPPGAYSEIVQRRVSELKERYGIQRAGAPAKQRAIPPPRVTQLSLFGAG